MKTIKNHKGQLSIINIIFFLIIVVVGAVVTPIMNSVITDMINSTNLTSSAELVANSIIVFFWLGIVITFFLFVTPQRPAQY